MWRCAKNTTQLNQVKVRGRLKKDILTVKKTRKIGTDNRRRIKNMIKNGLLTSRQNGNNTLNNKQKKQNREQKSLSVKLMNLQLKLNAKHSSKVNREVVNLMLQVLMLSFSISLLRKAKGQIKRD